MSEHEPRMVVYDKGVEVSKTEHEQIPERLYRNIDIGELFLLFRDGKLPLGWFEMSYDDPGRSQVGAPSGRVMNFWLDAPMIDYKSRKIVLGINSGDLKGTIGKGIMRWDVINDRGSRHSRSRHEYYINEEIAVDNIDVSFPNRDAYDPMLVDVYCAAHYLKLQEICSILYRFCFFYFTAVADMQDSCCFKDRSDLQRVIGGFPKKSESQQFFREVDRAKDIIKNIIEAEFGPNLPDDVCKEDPSTNGYEEYQSRIRSGEWIDLGGNPSVIIKRSYLSKIEQQLLAFNEWLKQCKSKKTLPEYGSFKEEISLDDIDDD
jgi:hypothetical protein